MICGNCVAIRTVPGVGVLCSYLTRHFVEEMQIQGARMLSMPMQMSGTDLQAHSDTFEGYKEDITLHCS